MIDITTAATIRPEILDVTYSSFKKHLFKDCPCRVFINIDPIGETDTHTAQDVIDVARSYFDDVTVHEPERPDFTIALIWLWRHVESELFFNLEDDWKLNADVNFQHMIYTMRKHKKLAVLTLAKGRSWERTAQFSHSNKKPLGVWNGEYYDVPGRRYGGMPSLIRKEFIQGFLPHLQRTRINHECLERTLYKQKHPCITDWTYGGYTEPNLPHALFDNIGKKWKKRQGFRKKIIGRNIGWHWKKR